MRTKPFAAFQPPPELASRVAAVPYDVVDTAEARALAAGNPDSFLHVTRPDIDLPDGTDPYAPAVYRQSASAWQELQTRRVMCRDTAERFYVYRQVMGAHCQTGVVACCHVDDYARDIIRKHERTRQDKEDDRTRHVLALNANAGPVFLTHRDDPAITALVVAATRELPLYDFTAADGVRHVVWRVAGDSPTWVAAFDRLPLAYVADGHHRAAAAARAGRERQAANPRHAGTEAYNWFLAVLFPASQLCVLPYNRCVSGLNGLDPESLLARVREHFTVTPTTGSEASVPRTARMYLAGHWHQLSWPPFEADPVGRLDVSVLQDRLLAPLLGVADPRTDSRISFIGGSRGLEALARRVDSGQADVAFALHPVTVDQMMDIADANQIMPPKSTWFEPKLRSGLLVHALD